MNTSSISSAVRTYNGTASVGDFLTISLDSTAHTITYANHSNGDSGTVPYTVNSDGTYSLNDSTGNLLSAYEVPNYALLIQAAKTGPNHNTAALITAVESGAISINTWANHQFNYMQFRTNSGGLEIGSVSIDGSGNVSNSSYWPFGGDVDPNNAFNSGQMPASGFQADPSGTFLTLPDGQGSNDYVFGTANGIFAVDTPNGAILGLQMATSKTFDTASAGTYKASFYQKVNASTGQGNIETGTASLGNATLTIGSTGDVTLTDAQNNVMAQGTLTAVADTPYMYDGSPNKLANPGFGLFTFRVTTANSRQDFFLTFVDRAVLFSSFKTAIPLNQGNTYDYYYGVALK